MLLKDKDTKLEIAEKDIHVKKILKNNYAAPFIRYQYKKGKLHIDGRFRIERVVKLNGDQEYRRVIGFHTYREIQEEDDMLFVVTEKDKHTLVCPSSSMFLVADAIIPEGSSYYYDEDSGIFVSNKLLVL